MKFDLIQRYINQDADTEARRLMLAGEAGYPGADNLPMLADIHGICVHLYSLDINGTCVHLSLSLSFTPLAPQICGVVQLSKLDIWN